MSDEGEWLNICEQADGTKSATKAIPGQSIDEVVGVEVGADGEIEGLPVAKKRKTEADFYRGADSNNAVLQELSTLKNSYDDNLLDSRYADAIENVDAMI